MGETVMERTWCFILQVLPLFVKKVIKGKFSLLFWTRIWIPLVVATHGIVKKMNLTPLEWR